jgi:hypothetical protein
MTKKTKGKPAMPTDDMPELLLKAVKKIKILIDHVKNETDPTPEEIAEALSGAAILGSSIVLSMLKIAESLKTIADREIVNSGDPDRT